MASSKQRVSLAPCVLRELDATLVVADLDSSGSLHHGILRWQAIQGHAHGPITPAYVTMQGTSIDGLTIRREARALLAVSPEPLRVTGT